jgi:hypothetical protein
MSSYPSKIGWKIISDMSLEGIQGREQAEIAKLPMARLLELYLTELAERDPDASTALRNTQSTDLNFNILNDSGDTIPIPEKMRDGAANPPRTCEEAAQMIKREAADHGEKRNVIGSDERFRRCKAKYKTRNRMHRLIIGLCTKCYMI